MTLLRWFNNHLFITTGLYQAKGKRIRALREKRLRKRRKVAYAKAYKHKTPYKGYA